MTTTCRSTSSTILAGRGRQRLAAGIVLLALATMAQTASAACTWRFNGTPVNYLFTPTINLGTLSTATPADAPIGSTIATATFSVGATGCSSNQYFNLLSQLNPATSLNSVWQISGIPGVGLELKINGVLLSDLSSGQIRNIGGPGTAYPTTTFSYRLVKIGSRMIGNTGSAPSKYQVLPSALIPFALSADSTMTGFTTGGFSGPPLSVLFPISTCGGNTGTTVTLPVANASTFTAIGSTTGDTSFNFTLNQCSPGGTVWMTLSDNYLNGNTTDKLSLDPASTASGIALQILYNGIPRSFYGGSTGASSDANSNPSQFNTAIPVGSMTTSIPLTVRYIRTGTVTPGTVNAKAVVTMSYQ